jgi:hypothetical protein
MLAESFELRVISNPAAFQDNESHHSTMQRQRLNTSKQVRPVSDTYLGNLPCQPDEVVSRQHNKRTPIDEAIGVAYLFQCATRELDLVSVSTACAVDAQVMKSSFHGLTVNVRIPAVPFGAFLNAGSTWVRSWFGPNMFASFV